MSFSADLAVSMLPYIHHVTLAKECIKQQKQMVTTSYVSPAMRRFEADRNDIGGSVYRHNRAMRLLRENYGRLSPERLQAAVDTVAEATG